MDDELQTTATDQPASAEPTSMQMQGPGADQAPVSQSGSEGDIAAGVPTSTATAPAMPQETAPEKSEPAAQNDITPLLPPVKLPQDFANDAIETANAMALKKIHPKTMQELYADKDFMGKAGTIFGLIVSGMGAGMSGQSNALLDMLNKQIANDLEAQKAQGERANTWLSTTYAHQLQQAQANKIAAETSKIPLEMKHQDLVNKGQDIANNISSVQLAKDRAILGMLTGFQNGIDKSPPAVQPQAQAALDNQVKPFFLNNMANEHQQASQVMQDNFANTNMALQAAGLGGLARDRQEREVPGVGTASIPVSGADREKITQMQNFTGQMDRLTNMVKNMSDVDRLNPAKVAQAGVLAKEVQQSFKNSILGGNFSQNERDYLNKIIPEDPSKFVPSLRVLPLLNEVNENAKMRYQNLLKAHGITPKQQPQSKTQAWPYEGTVIVNPKTGERQIGKNGAWVTIK